MESTNGQSIVLTFAVFDIHPNTYGSGFCYDYVQINDGSSDVGQRYCVNNPGSVTSSGTTITVKFYSSSVNTASGFLAFVCCSAVVTSDNPGESSALYLIQL